MRAKHHGVKVVVVAHVFLVPCTISLTVKASTVTRTISSSLLVGAASPQPQSALNVRRAFLRCMTSQQIAVTPAESASAGGRAAVTPRQR